MAGSGEIYQDKAGKFRFRVKASNGQIVANGQGYATKASAKSTLTKLLAGQYDGPITEASE